LLISLNVFIANSQSIDVKKFEGLSSRSIGPAGMSGRVTSIDVVRDQPDVIFIGTASGGVWKSESGGIHWKPVFDDEPVQAIGAVAIDQNNPSVVWAGTGEGNPRNSVSCGEGIFKSLDGGRTWQYMGLDKTRAIHRIIIHPNNPDIVYAAALGSPWGPNQERGVYKTTDGGQNWDQILHLDDTTGCADLVMDPSNPNKLFAAMWEYHRQPWFFTSGGNSSGLYMTHDGGDNWKERTHKHGLPEGKKGRMGLAIARSNPDRVYALVESENTALYRSDNGGFQWQKVNDKNVGNRPFYYADIRVDPQNENRVYNLHSTMTISEDGGKSFKSFLSYSEIHPDHHAFYIHPDDPDFLIDGNDGGLAISHDRGESWKIVRNLPLGQFYHINYDMDTPYNVYGGMQDNGSWIGPERVWQRGGIRNHHWQELLFGDGFDVVPHPANDRYGFAMYQGGNVYRYDRQTGNREYVQPQTPGDDELRFNWNAAISEDPFQDSTIYFGSQYVHKSTNNGLSWETISPDLTTDDSTKQRQAESGGLTIDATRAENFITIVTIAPSPLDDEVIWAGTDDGNIQLTQNDGETWTNIAGNIEEMPDGAWVQQIIASEHDKRTAFAVVNDYRRNNWAPYLVKTTDFGKSWERIVDNEDVRGHTYTVAQDPEVADLMFLGTSRGLFFTIDGGDNWQKWRKDDFPSVIVRDLKIHPREHDLIIGTFGRAAYILDDIRPLREMASSEQKMTDLPFYIFNSSDGTLAHYKAANRAHFNAEATFKGQNQKRAATINIWLKEVSQADDKENKENKKTKSDTTEANKKKKKQAKKFTINITNNDGDTIRTFTTKADTGLNSIHWGMNRNGVRYPSYKTPEPKADTPSGPTVLPGQYKAHISYQNFSGTTTLQVHQDPRIDVSDQSLAKKQDIILGYLNVVQTATDAFNRLKEAKKTVGDVNKNMEHADKDVQKELKKKGKAMTGKIDSLMHIFKQPKDFQGYDHVTTKLTKQLYNTSRFLNSANGVPGKNAMTALRNTRNRVKEVTDTVNVFFQSEWPSYRQEVEEATLPMFQEYEPLQME
jgi:photosystem II stability/assembly factor-like uncharacterized protein